MKWHIARIILLLALLLPMTAAAQPREDVLVIPAGQIHDGNLATTTQDIRVEGVVMGDVTSWSGDIEVLGRVSGDVVSYGGTVTIRSPARVGGHILASGGQLRLEAGAMVAGQAIRGEGGGGALASLLDLFSPAAASDADTAIGRVLFGAVLGVFLLAFCLLCIAFWPRRTAAASVMLRHATGRALTLGLLTTLMLTLALPPLVALLAATLIGLPLLVLLLALIQIPYVYGLATLARFVGARRGAEIAAPDRTTLAVAAGAALLVAITAALAPLWGVALFYVLASPGLGAAILSRGGLFAPVYR
jgi:hypothetical protein